MNYIGYIGRYLPIDISIYTYITYIIHINIYPWFHPLTSIGQLTIQVNGFTTFNAHNRLHVAYIFYNIIFHNSMDNFNKGEIYLMVFNGRNLPYI